MITTTSRSCNSLSYPATTTIPNHHQQDLDLQVKKLFETWPKGACKEHRLKIKVFAAAAAAAEKKQEELSTTSGRCFVSKVPMSDVCPYPLRGNLSSNGGGGSSSTNNNNNNSRSNNSGGGGGEPNTSRSPEIRLGGVAAGGGGGGGLEDHSHLHPFFCTTTASSSSSTLQIMDNYYSLDFDRIANTVSKLDLCGWYYGQMSWQQATNMLKSKPVGTFLLRDSSDPLFLFALSVQTERGPTSVRIHYADGQFKLDAESNLFGTMPLFDCVVKLVDYYVQLSQSDKSKAHVWLDDSGRRDLPVRLNKPLYCRVPQLQHLSRLVINDTLPPLQRLNDLDLPKSLLSYIRDYPYRR